MTIYATPIRDIFDESSLPLDFPTATGGALGPLLDRVFYTDVGSVRLEDARGLAIDLVIAGEASLALPGLDGFELVLGASESEGLSELSAGVLVSPRGVSASLSEVVAALRFPPHILKPVAPDDGSPAPAHAQIEASGGLELDENLDLTLVGFDSLRLPPSMIGDSGIVIEADDVKPDFSRTGTPKEIKQAGFDDSFLGLYIGEARVRLPDGLPQLAPEDLVLRDCAIGSGGVSGELTASYPEPVFDPATGTYSGPGAGDLFGLAFALRSASVRVKQNAFIESTFTGQLLVPYFDKRLEAEIEIGLDGELSVEVTGAAEAGDAYDAASGLLRLERPGLFELLVESLRFELEDGELITSIGGRFTPQLAGLDWPSFAIEQLSIDTAGRVRLEGGWLDLRDQYSFDFHGFGVELTKIAFGTSEEGERFMGLSGGLKLTEGLSAGASVEGLRAYWSSDGSSRVTFEGVGVEFEIPEVLRFKGKIAYRDPADGQVSEPRFDGAIDLDLLALDMSIDGTLVVGSEQGDTYLAIYLASEFPAGIPLWATGLSLYGVSGLMALDMEPDKRPDEEWYEGWYKRPSTGVTDLAGKWRPQLGSSAFGAGVTIGTAADNGYGFSGRMLLAMVLPGPIVLVEGKANILQSRASLDGGEPTFRALAVVDKREDTLLVGLDAGYKYDASGRLIDIGGSAEAFFDFVDADNWHLYLGEDEPRDRRLRAEIFRLFDVEAYFMLEPGRLATGAWFGYDESWRFGPLSVKLEAWVDGAAVVSWNPNQFHGELWLHGAAGLSVWGFGVELGVDARLSAEVFDPYHILGEFEVHIGLPWPLSDISKRVPVEWGPQLDAPPLALPLEQVAIEHLEVSTTWPLARGELLLPNYGDGGQLESPDVDPAVIALRPPSPQAPVVPLDARPRLTFARPVHDDALVGVNPQPPVPEFEVIGDPEAGEGPVEVRYGVREVVLEKWRGGAWQRAARKVGPDHPQQNPAEVPELFGSWAPVPRLGGGEAQPTPANSKLWLWSKTPFDYMTHGGGDWGDWWQENYPGYPCLVPPSERTECFDFENVDPNLELISPWTHPGTPQVRLSWTPAGIRHVELHPGPHPELQRWLALDAETAEGEDGRHVEARLELPRPTRRVDVTVYADSGVVAFGEDADGTVFGPFAGGLPQDPHVTVAGEDLVLVRLEAHSTLYLGRVCVVRALSGAEIDDITTANQHAQEALEVWSRQGEVLEPHTDYRLRVVTTVESRSSSPLPAGGEQHEVTEFAFFKTEGAPGLATLSEPAGRPAADRFDSGLDDLEVYVRQTLPETVPAAGETPHQPRRPVYRGDDVGVAFSVDYVDLLYRAGGRDLGLWLFDNNDRPVTGAAAVWGTLAAPLDPGEQQWVDMLDEAPCTQIDVSEAPGDSTLVDSRGRVLAADTIYEARLIPMLRRDGFLAYALGDEAAGSGARLGHWRVDDEGTVGTSLWQVGEDAGGRFVEQVTNIFGGSIDGADPVKPGTLLLTGDDAWVDYRLRVLVSSADDDAIGVVFRYRGNGDFYRFSMDRERRYRRLVKVTGGVHEVLAEDDVVYRRERWYELTVEAVGESLEVWIDGERAFSVLDPSHERGGIGLYSWASEGARFRDVRVDDLAADAPVVYRFPFTTSRYRDFGHQLHSFQDRLWPRHVPAATDLTSAAAAAVAAQAPVGEQEARAYALLEEQLGAVDPPGRCEVSALLEGGQTRALWLRNPEPIDWHRCSLEARTHQAPLPAGREPGELKILAASGGGLRANDEQVTLLCRGEVNLSDYRLEQLGFPGMLAERPSQRLLEDRFEGRSGEPGSPPLLLQRGFESLSELEIVDAVDPQDLASAWRIDESGVLEQQTAIRDPSPAALGTRAVLGDAEWRDVEITARLEADAAGTIGLLARFEDAQNHYRLLLDSESGHRQLVKVRAGLSSVLWQDDVVPAVGAAEVVTLRLEGPRLRGTIGGQELFDLTDDGAASGRVGFFTQGSPGARFESLEVRDRTRRVGRWRVVDRGLAGGPSEWDLQGGRLRQRSAIDGAGTLAVSGESWRDYRFTARLRGDGAGSLGLVFRYRGEGDYFRLAADLASGGLRLEVCEQGELFPLWLGTGAVELGEPFELAVDAGGERLVGYLDGVRLFELRDDRHPAGGVGFFSSGDVRAHVDTARVEELSQESRALWRDAFLDGDLSEWTISDHGSQGGVSAWQISDGVLAQTSNIHDTPLDAAVLAKLGTRAVAGDPAWRDVVFGCRLESRDNDAIGVFFRYRDEQNYYRFSMDSERSYRRLVKSVGGVVTLLWQSGDGYQPARPYELIVAAVGDRLRASLDGVPLFSVIDGDLADGRIGLYCWGNDASRFSQVRVHAAEELWDAWSLRDDFVVLDDRWQLESDTGSSTGRWRVAASELVHDAAPSTGVDLALADRSPGADRRLSALVTLDDLAATAGLVAGHEAGEYDALVLAAQGRRLISVRSVGGSVQETVLWSDAVASEIGRPYLVTLERVGPRWIGAIDGSIVVDIEPDSSPLSGDPGFYAAAEGSCRFGELRVSEPTWQQHALLRGGRLAAGTVVTVRSGHARHAGAPSEPLVLDLYSAEQAEHGRSRLAERPHLRLVGPAGPEHERAFFETDVTNPEAPRVLRSADGTGAVVFDLSWPPDARAARGEYHLDLVYRRDNQAIDPQSMVRTRSDDASPEHVVLRVPRRPSG